MDAGPGTIRAIALHLRGCRGRSRASKKTPWRIVVTVRRMRGASLGVAGALAAGLVIAPSGGATAAGSDGPDFYSVGATSVASDAGSGDSAARSSTRSASRTDAARSAAVSSGLQALQVFNGANGIGNDGVTVAAGPKHLMQVGGPTVRIFTKNASKVVSTEQLGQFFDVPGTTFSQGTVVYDPLGKRWIAAAVTDDGGDTGLALRASTGTKPTAWQPSVLFAGADDTGNPDAVELNPMIGTSGDKIVITTPITDADEPGNVNRIFFFPKSPIYSGNSPDPWTADLNSTWNGEAPAVNASGQNNIFVAIPSTDDVQISTFTGAATTSAPNFSKIVVYPSTSLTAPPVVDQGAAGDNLDLGPLAFSGAAWRSGKLFATAAGNCSGDACIRLIGITTESGGTLIEDEKFASTTGADWFSPSVAIDGAGYVHTAATAVSADDLGPSLAVLTLTKISLANTAGANLKARVIALGTEAFDNNGTSGQTVDWSGSTGAAIDPTSPWDVWVTGAVGSDVVASPNLTTSIARVSMAKNNATIKASATKVKKGTEVTFTCKLVRPDSSDTFKGLPISLQRKGGGQWKKIANGTTTKKGVFKATVTIKNPGQYRTLGKAVTQVGGQGQSVEKVASQPISISLK
jgi:hypothetical protein